MGKKKKREKAQRVLKVTGYLVFKESDPGFQWSLDTLGDTLSGFEELTIQEIPGARLTKRGIRTDVDE